MQLQLVAIRDNAIDSFLPPVFVQHVGAAVREFRDACNREDHDFFKHPSDYDIWHLGVFDQNSGAFSPPEGGKPERLARGQDMKVVVALKAA